MVPNGSGAPGAPGPHIAHPTWRATAVGVHRLWRDTGDVVGALLGGVVTDLFDLRAAVWPSPC